MVRQLFTATKLGCRKWDGFSKKALILFHEYGSIIYGKKIILVEIGDAEIHLNVFA